METTTSWSKLVKLISELPKNLNGKNLQIYFKINLNSTVSNLITEMKENPLIFEDFFGGTIQLIGNIASKLSISNDESISFITDYPLNVCSSIQFKNCSNIDLLNLKFGLNDATNTLTKYSILSFVNCKRVNISNCVYINMFVSDSNIKIDHSNIYITNSYFNFDKLTTYKGEVTNASKVFVSETVFIYNNGKLNKNNEIKKFEVDKNSYVTWINLYDTVDTLLNNVSAEFNLDTTTNGIANHAHSSLLSDTGLNDITNISTISSLTTSIPVGTTFYWPRAFTVSNYTDNTKLLSSLITFPTNDSNYNNYFVTGYSYNDMNIIHNIPFLSGAIPLDNNGMVGPDNKTWEQRWSSELNKLPNNIKNSELLKKINTSTINSKLFKLSETEDPWKFKFKHITVNSSNYTHESSVSNKILNLAIINCNCTGPSVRTERADRFGYLDYFPADGKNGCGFSITAGATHNWGGENQSEYRILDKIKSKLKTENPFYFLNKYNTNEKYTVGNDQKLIKEHIQDVIDKGGTYKEIPPPHDEYWYSRQGLHIVYQFGFTDADGNSCLPEYLEYGFLKFSYNLVRNTNGLGNWYGTFMIADEYFIPYSAIHVKEPSACGGAYPKEKYFPLVSFKTNSKTVWKIAKNQSYIYYYDPEDVPLYGNYFLMNSGDIYLPLNKIAGKFLIFGLRGTYSTTKTELDNGRYMGVYRGNSEPTETCSTIKFSDFKIIPAILPYKTKDPYNNELWRISNSSPLLLNNINANQEEGKISLAGFGTRYYTTPTFLYRSSMATTENNATLRLSDLADFYADKTIVSDTVLCVKTEKSVKLIEPDIQKEDILITPELLYWYIKPDATGIPNTLLNTLFYITNGSQTSLKDIADVQIYADKAKSRLLLYSDTPAENRSVNMYQITNYPCITYDKTYNYINKYYNNGNDLNIETSDNCSILSVQTNFTLVNTTSIPETYLDIYNYYFIEDATYTPSSFLVKDNDGRNI